MALAGFVFEI